MSIVIAGTHTGIGKTLCSAVLCQARGYDYWKPVQAGDLDYSDTAFIRSHVHNPSCHIHAEAFALKTPMSPHYAAALDGITITLDALHLPSAVNPMVVETAGGLMSPLSDRLTNLDLIARLALPVVLVSADYLGSINHTLLSVDVLQRAKVNMLGLVFSGKEEPSSRSFILSYTRLPLLFSIPHLDRIDAYTVERVSNTLSIPAL